MTSLSRKIVWKRISQGTYASHCSRFRIQSIRGVGLRVDRWELVDRRQPLPVLSEVRIGECKREAERLYD